VDKVGNGGCVVSLACKLGSVRLIDNVVLRWLIAQSIHDYESSKFTNHTCYLTTTKRRAPTYLQYRDIAPSSRSMNRGEPWHLPEICTYILNIYQIHKNNIIMLQAHHKIGLLFVFYSHYKILYCYIINSMKCVKLFQEDPQHITSCHRVKDNGSIISLPTIDDDRFVHMSSNCLVYLSPHTEIFIPTSLF
jgi:hypothetical protein